MTGYSKHELEGKMKWSHFVVEEDLDKMKHYYKMRRLTPGSAPGSYEFRFTNRKGEVRDLFMNVAVIPGTKESIASFIDMTESKNLEEQLTRAQKMEAIGTLAGGLAHDFNNLLMGILGNVSLLRMNFDETDPFFDRLKKVEEYVKRGSDLTKQLLGFARGGKYEVKPTDLGDFILKSSEMFGRTRKEISIHHGIQDGLWPVEVDKGQMEQVLLNLYVNAWQAMPGGGDLYLSVENVELDELSVSPYGIKPGEFVKLKVTDTGIGMDEATKARIFEPFFTTKEQGHGTGLGLASVYGIIKNHGGYICVESKEKLGTTFIIYLPASGKRVEDEYRSEDAVQKGHETVLLIDDEEMILDVGSEMLEALGYKVMTAAGGKLGLKIYEQNRDKIDLVILDMIMPEFGGADTFEALRRIDPSIRVLLSSGYSVEGQAKEIIQNGCKGFIQKPFSMTELSGKIRITLDKKHVGRDTRMPADSEARSQTSKS
jgi:PAS domain S-box-containing protein